MKLLTSNGETIRRILEIVDTDNVPAATEAAVSQLIGCCLDQGWDREEAQHLCNFFAHNPTILAAFETNNVRFQRDAEDWA